MIRARREGKEVRRPVEREEAPPDLTEALRASLQSAGRGRDGGGRPTNESLARLSRSELEARARAARIPGRSRMSKDELVEALGPAA